MEFWSTGEFACLITDSGDVLDPEQVAVVLVHELKNRALFSAAHKVANWIAKHDASLERALLEGIVMGDEQSDPRLLPWLLGAPRLLAKARANRADIDSGRASARWAASRARKKVARGLSLTEMEKNALRER